MYSEKGQKNNDNNDCYCDICFIYGNVYAI